MPDRLRQTLQRQGGAEAHRMLQAIRHFIFVVPAGVGVQEAGLVGFGYLLGVGNDASIALSLAKRMREVLFGVPALVYWQLK